LSMSTTRPPSGADPDARPSEIVVAIDGPAGAGKSTLAANLARALGLPYVNTGLMYRAVAARALAEGVAPGDEGALEAIARSLRFELSTDEPPALLIDGTPPPYDLGSK